MPVRHRIHPLTIFSNLWRIFYLIIIPIFRGFFYALQGDLGQWLRSAWIDILLFLFMIAVAVWRWHAVTYTYDERALVLDNNWIVGACIRIPWERVATVSVLEAFYLRPFKAALVRADTIGGSAGRADFSILMWKEQADRILQRTQNRDERPPARAYMPKTGSVLALSLLTSNSLGGVLFISAFVSQTGRLLGNEFSELLIGAFEQAMRLLAFGLPPAAAATAYILLGGWFIGFLLTFLRYKNFVVSRSREMLHISGGVFSTRDYCIRCAHVNFVDIRQSITTRALNLYSMYISAAGYAKNKDDLHCIIPTESRDVFVLHRERLFPSFSPAPRTLAPRLQCVMRYTGFPLFLLGLLLAATPLFIWKFPGWRTFILFVGLMLMVPALFFLLLRVVSFSTAGIAKNGKYYTIRYANGFYLHTVIIPEDKIVSFELRQSFFQKFSPDCDLLVSTRAEGLLIHRCRGLNKAALQKMLSMQG